MRSEFLDNNRAIDFVRNEEAIRKDIPSSSKRAYHNAVYTLGLPSPPGEETLEKKSLWTKFTDWLTAYE
jgi:hypothetical protein